MTTPDPTDRLTAEQVIAWFGEPRYSVTDLQRAYRQGYDAALAAPAPDLLAAVKALEPPWHSDDWEPTVDFVRRIAIANAGWNAAIAAVVALIESRSLSASREAGLDADLSPQDWLDIFDRTADRPAIRAKITARLAASPVTEEPS